MNRVLSFLSVVGLAGAMFSCDEIPPTITPCQSNKVVLVEEFTGVKCINCPDAAAKLASFDKANPGKIIVVGIHSGSFSRSYLGFDLRNDASDQLTDYLAPVNGRPNAVINRKNNDGDEVLALGSITSTWTAQITEELCAPPLTQISTGTVYDAASRTATLTVDIDPVSGFAPTTPVAVSVMLTENNVIGPQQYPSYTDTVYAHKHVLRSYVTPVSGERIYQGDASTATTEQKSYTVTIPADLDAENCEFVVFTHYQGNGINDKEVLQATYVAVVK